MDRIEFDVIVVGSGAAGLFAALNLPKEEKVLLISKDEFLKSDSYLAQGGISTLLGEEDYNAYFEDTLRAGRYENKKESVKELILASPIIIDDLVSLGVEFDRTQEGKFHYTREGAHCAYRILHHKDVTGKEIVSKLLMEVSNRENISMMPYTTMLDLISNENCCNGIVMERENRLIAAYAKAVILATGGLGGLFHSSTNYSHITGDSFAIALRHGIELENIHYIQIHPTVLYSKNEERRFLISESVRGEGGILLNEERARFVDELLPRDVVTEAIYKEMKRFHTDHVYLSLAHLESTKVIARFPNIYERLLLEGYDITKDLIPVTPAQHYLMGGIRTNLMGETSMKHLYAIGETACTGVHGANRLASNSLLECLVFAKNAAKAYNQKDKDYAIDYRGILPSKLEEEQYLDLNALKENNKKLLLDEIRRKDEDFYDKWYNISSECR